MNNMTPNLIELIVQAVMNTLQRNLIPASEMHLEDKIRDALASIPEMPQVDLGEVEKLVQKVASNNAESVKSYYQKSQADIDRYAEQMRSRIGYSISDLPLTAPPTKTE